MCVRCLSPDWLQHLHFAILCVAFLVGFCSCCDCHHLLCFHCRQAVELRNATNMQLKTQKELKNTVVIHLIAENEIEEIPFAI